MGHVGRGHRRTSSIRAALAGLLGCALIAAASSSLRSQALPQQPEPPQFRSSIDIESIDVLVLDRQRRPVRGLTAADFTVLVDGRPQPVLVLTEVDLGVVERPPAPAARAFPDDVASNVTDARRIVVLLFDDATMPGDPLTVRQAKNIGQAAIDQLGPHDQAAVVFTADGRRAQGPTGERARLRAAVETLTSGFGAMQAYEEDVGAYTDAHLHAASLRTLSSVVDALRNLRDMRKVLIYVSIGVPIDFDAGSTPVLSGALGLVSGEVQRGFIARLRELLEGAARANVSIYAVDPGGLQAIAGAPDSRRGDFLMTMSGETGGRAIINTNDLVDGVGVIFAENASHYVLGVEARAPARAGATSRLEVRVNRPGVTVRARNLSVLPEAPRSANTRSVLNRALASVIPERSVPLRVAPIPYPARAGQTPPVVIVSTIVRPPSETRATGKFELLTAVFDQNHRVVRQIRQTAEADMPPSRTGMDINVLSRIDLRPGRYHIRTAVRDTTTGESGSVYTDVDVADFRREPLSLSGLVLVSGSAVPRDPEIADLIPAVPTTSRRFLTTDRVLLQARVYQDTRQPPQPVTVTVQVDDAIGNRVEATTETFAADRFGKGHTATVTYELPLASLAAGEYALTLLATNGGRSITRSLRFAIEE